VRVVSLVSRCRCVDVSPSGEVTPASARQCRTALWARLAEAVRRRLIRASVRSRFKLTLLARLLPGLTVGKSLDEGLRSSRTKRSLPCTARFRLTPLASLHSRLRDVRTSGVRGRRMGAAAAWCFCLFVLIACVGTAILPGSAADSTIDRGQPSESVRGHLRSAS
jgi:hypothetical protein